MKKKIALLSALVGSAIFSGQTFAALSSAANVSSRNVKPSTWETIKKKSSISYFAEFNDQSAINQNEEEAANQNFYYQAISARYEIDDTWTARADLRMLTQEGSEDMYSTMNPRLGLQGVVYASGNFSVFSLTRLEFGMTKDARNADQVIKPKFYNAANYSLGAHSFSVGLELSKWIYDDTEEKADNQYGTYADLTYRYTFNDKASFQTYVELPGSVRNGQGLFEAERAQASERYLIGMDLALSKNFMNIAKNVTIFPHIDFQPENDNGTGDLGIGAWISAGFFQ